MQRLLTQSGAIFRAALLRVQKAGQEVLKLCRAVLVQASQKMTNSLMLTTCMMNIGTLFSVSAMATAATASFVGASAFGLISLINFVKVCACLCSPSFGAA